LSHDAASVELYFQESFTFLVYTAEAGVALGAAEDEALEREIAAS
jgi:uncharacterized linocin/CFP29 family protein